MPTKKFLLLEDFNPVIKDKLVEIDPGMGGIKLIYQEKDTKSSLRFNNNKRIFLKPFKEVIAIDKKDCEITYGKGSWGNANNPISNCWVEITSKDYSNYNQDSIGIRFLVVKDTQLIKSLNERKKEFILGIDDEPNKITKLSIMDKARLFYDQLMYSKRKK